MAASNLRQALHVARRILGSQSPATASRYLERWGELLELCPDAPLWVDVEAFEEAAAAARRAGDPANYRAALDLYAGDLLPEDRYEDWAEERREGLRGTYLALLLEPAGLYEERGEFGPAVEALRRLLRSEPAHEGAHAGLMRLMPSPESARRPSRSTSDSGRRYPESSASIPPRPAGAFTRTSSRDGHFLRGERIT